MIEKYVTWAITFGGFGITIFLIKFWFSKLGDKLDLVETKHQECREHLPVTYANKQETTDKMKEICRKLELNAKEHGYMEGLRNGRIK